MFILWILRILSSRGGFGVSEHSFQGLGGKGGGEFDVGIDLAGGDYPVLTVLPIGIGDEVEALGELIPAAEFGLFCWGGVLGI